MVQRGTTGTPYYLVKYGDRIQLEKAHTPEEALKQAFLKIEPGMQYKHLGSRAKVFKKKADFEALKNSPDGWETV